MQCCDSNLNLNRRLELLFQIFIQVRSLGCQYVKVNGKYVSLIKISLEREASKNHFGLKACVKMPLHFHTHPAQGN